MSQPHYSDNYSQRYCYSNSYDTVAQSREPAYNNFYYNQGAVPSARAVDDLSVLAARSYTYAYPGIDYTTDTTANHYSSYAPAPNNMAPHYPGLANQVIHQVAPGQTWVEEGRYAEVATAQPNNHHEQLRGSRASSTDGNDWYLRNQVSTGHYGHQQPVHVKPNYDTSHHNYDLSCHRPATKSIYAAWQPTFQSSIAIVALFGSVLPEHLDPDSAGGQALFVFTYLGFFFSLSATLSSLVLTNSSDQVQDYKIQRASSLEPPNDLVVHEDPNKRVTHNHDMRKPWKPMMWYWLFMLVSGHICVVGQLLVYIWMMAPKTVAIALSCATLICLVPLLLSLLFR